MRLHRITFYMLFAVMLGGCATSKKINEASDIQDDGKSNVAVLTYDVTLYATDRYPTSKSTTLSFHCPENSALNRNNCFSFSVPYKGLSEYDGYNLYTYESSGATVMKLKYDALSATHGLYKILLDVKTERKCSYNKKLRKRSCYPQTVAKHDSHRFSLPEPIPLIVTPGSGCYMGHLSLNITNDSINEYDFKLDAELTPEKLANLDSAVSSAVQRFVDRPCY